jgi:hypothetical protein
LFTNQEQDYQTDSIAHVDDSEKGGVLVLVIFYIFPFVECLHGFGFCLTNIHGTLPNVILTENKRC